MDMAAPALLTDQRQDAIDAIDVLLDAIDATRDRLRVYSTKEDSYRLQI
jgi:hypothetical protein